MIPRQGEIWWAEAEDQRRPVLVVTRLVRDIPTEIPVGPEQGLPAESVASCDNLQPIRRTFLTHRVGALTYPRQEICRALSALADC